MGGSRSVRSGKVIPEITMTGKTVLITGANTGLGLASAIDLARRGARVIMACRNMDKGTKAKETVEEQTRSSNVVLMELDLGSMESIRQFASNFQTQESRLDVLMNNAGVMMCPQSKTKDGFETHFGTNHLGHFLLTNLLLDMIKRSAPSRIVTLSSLAHEKSYGGKIYWDDMNLTNNYVPVKGYCQSKLMNVLFSRELSKRLEGTGVTTYCVHPGGVDTDLQRYIGTHENPTCSDRVWSCVVCCLRPCVFKTPEEGAQTQVYCSVAPELEKVTGKYYAECKETRESADGRNDEYAKRLWEISEQYTNLK